MGTDPAGPQSILMVPFLVGAVRLILAVQATRTGVSGTVRDGESGQALAGAVVALADLDRMAAITDTSGHYLLGDVPAGMHPLTVHSIGYAPRTLQVLVPPDGSIEINLSLHPQPVHLPTIEVRSPTGNDLGRPGSAGFPDRGSSIAAVRNNPLLAEPDVFQALGGGEVSVLPESPSGLHLRGGASDQIGYLLDGIPVLNPYHAAGMFSAWNPDALSRVDLSSSAPSPAGSDVLSGVVAATTLPPGPFLRTRGSLSSMQARLTMDGPLGWAGAGFLVSLRSGHPGVVAPKGERSYLRGMTRDWLAKLEVPALGGQVRLLGYESRNDLNASAAANAEPTPGHNVFEWHSRSLGGEWSRTFSRTTLRFRGWSATTEAGSAWAAQNGKIAMRATRRDGGAVAMVEKSSAIATTIAGLRMEASRAAYGIDPDSGGYASLALSALTTVTTAFVEHARALGGRVDFKLGASLGAATGSLHLGPRAQLRWRPSAGLTLSGSYARLHQFAQSLRNAESVVGTVFPADLYVGAGVPHVPIARSDQAVIAADYRPGPGVRLGVQAYKRRFNGLLLVAPQEGEPFATGAFDVGTGESRGLSLDAGLTTARLGLVASYGLQHLRLGADGFSYVPAYGATHLLQAGVIVFPTASSSIRLGLEGGWGRRTTTIASGFEWEACNLLDKGCEFSGSPHYGGEPLGGTALPAYWRLDLGFRKTWYIAVGGRKAALGLFGTATNLLGRTNVLTYAKDPSTGRVLQIEMRPRAPLVVGLDWQF